MKKVYVLIDGGYLRVIMRDGGFDAFSADNVEKIAHACAEDKEELLKVLFYDCRPYFGPSVKKPISNEIYTFAEQQYRLESLAQKDLFAMRFGELKFQGWERKKERNTVHPTDRDFRPKFVQKGVDMRIGIDMAIIAEKRMVDRLIIIAGDTDLIPALKLCRRQGIQVILVQLPKPVFDMSKKLLSHVDVLRTIPWPPNLQLVAIKNRR